MGAAACLGAILVPMNWRLAVEELHHIVVDAEPVWMFYDDAHGETIEGLSGMAGYPARQTQLEELPALIGAATESLP